MSEEKTTDANLKEEFRNLGRNIADAARAAWDTPERQKLQSEVEAGLMEMRSTLKQEYENFNESPAGQKLKQETSDLGDKVRSQEIEGKIRSELVSALQQVNKELQNLTDHLTTQPGDESTEVSDEEIMGTTPVDPPPAPGGMDETETSGNGEPQPDADEKDE